MTDTSAVLAAIERLRMINEHGNRATYEEMSAALSALEALVKEREAAATDLVGDKFLRAAQSSDAALADFVAAVGER